MKKNSFIAILLCMLLIIMLVGCGKQSSEKVNSEKAEQNVSGEDNKLKGKIEFFSQKQEVVATFEAIIKEFNNEYPDIEVELVTVPNSEQVLLSRLTTGDTPDVFTSWPWAPAYRIYNDEGFILKLTDEDLLKNVDPTILELTKQNGDYYSVPLALSGMGVYYNKKVFDDLKLDIPKTQEEFSATLKTLKKANITPILCPDKDVWTLGQYFDRTMGLIMHDQGEFFEKVAKGEASSVESEGLRRICKLFMELREYAQDDTLGTGYDQAVADFANGKAGMFYQGTWAISAIKKANPDFDFGMFPYPGETVEDTKVGVNIDNALCISSDSKNIELAKKFVEFVSRPQIAQMYADMDGSPSAIKGVQSSIKEADGLYSVISEGKSYRSPHTFWPNGLNNEIRNNLQKYIVEKDMDAFLKSIDDVVDTYYNE